MAKLESNLKNMVLSLFAISFVMAAALGYVYSLTKVPIEESIKKAELEAFKNVLPDFDNDLLNDFQELDGLTIYTAKKNDSIVGYAVKTFSEKGYSGKVTLIAGFNPKGAITKVEVLEHHETPGLGANMSGKFKDQFTDKNPAEFILKVKKDGGDVDAITASTITSRAFCEAVEKAYISLAKNVLQIKISGNQNDTCNISTLTPLKMVMPLFDNNPLESPSIFDGIEIFTGTKNKQVTGYSVKAYSNGFNGPVWVLTGFTIDGKIKDTYILKNKESIGYGSQLNNPEFKNQFIGKNPKNAKIAVKEDNGDCDAIAGATISSRAFCEAVLLAYETLSKNVLKSSSTDTSKAQEQKIDTTKLLSIALIKTVLPDFNNNPRTSVKIIDGNESYTALKNKTICGYAIKASQKGYNGYITILVGFKPDGSINNIAVISENETKGMGTEIREDYFKDQFLNKNPGTDNLNVKEDGGSVDAISGSTITSRAYCKAINSAFNTYKKSR